MLPNWEMRNSDLPDAALLAACFERNLPLPPVGAGLEEGELNAGIGSDGIQT